MWVSMMEKFFMRLGESDGPHPTVQRSIRARSFQTFFTAVVNRARQIVMTKLGSSVASGLSNAGTPHSRWCWYRDLPTSR